MVNISVIGGFTVANWVDLVYGVEGRSSGVTTGEVKINIIFDVIYAESVTKIGVIL